MPWELQRSILHPLVRPVLVVEVDVLVGNMLQIPEPEAGEVVQTLSLGWSDPCLDIKIGIGVRIEDFRIFKLADFISSLNFGVNLSSRSGSGKLNVLQHQQHIAPLLINSLFSRIVRHRLIGAYPPEGSRSRACHGASRRG
jgi:hypothetical protein